MCDNITIWSTRRSAIEYLRYEFFHNYLVNYLEVYLFLYLHNYLKVYHILNAPLNDVFKI